ncbi:hypothetical protein PTTG_03953, partial [Puccinia triticina 1-1 BBBD Race 1]
MATEQPRFPKILASLSDHLKRRILSGYAVDSCCRMLRSAIHRHKEGRLIEGLMFIEGRLVIPADPVIRLNLIAGTHRRLGNAIYLETARALRRNFFWPHMDEEVEIFIQSYSPRQNVAVPATTPPSKLPATSHPVSPPAPSLLGNATSDQGGSLACSSPTVFNCPSLSSASNCSTKVRSPDFDSSGPCNNLQSRATLPGDSSHQLNQLNRLSVPQPSSQSHPHCPANALPALKTSSDATLSSEAPSRPSMLSEKGYYPPPLSALPLLLQPIGPPNLDKLPPPARPSILLASDRVHQNPALPPAQPTSPAPFRALASSDSVSTTLPLNFRYSRPLPTRPSLTQQIGPPRLDKLQPPKNNLHSFNHCLTQIRRLLGDRLESLLIKNRTTPPHPSPLPPPRSIPSSPRANYPSPANVNL